MKSLTELLSSPSFQTYLAKQAKVARLNAIFGGALHYNWVKDCQIANFENGLLVLIVTNASWATQIRFATPQIIEKLRMNREFDSLREIKCKIIHKQPVATPPARKTLSESTKTLIFETAQTMTNTALKEALLRLSK